MKISCSRCGGQRTRRHDFRTYRQISLEGVESKGYQRWFCVDCKKPFIPVELKRPDVSPYNAEVREQSTILYIDTGGSYRAVTRQLHQWGLPHVDTMQVWHWIQEMGQKCADPFTISQTLRPQWSGWLQVDGDRVPVEGMDVSILAALDGNTRDVPGLVLGRETESNYRELFQQLKELKYPLKGLTSDGDSAILSAYKDVYPQGVHQRCTVHFQRNLDELLEPRFATYPQLPTEYERFQKAYHQFVSATHWYQAKEWVRFFLYYPSFQKPVFKPARDLFLRTLPQIIPAFFHPGMPRTNNLIENLFRFLDRRLTPMDRFQARESAWSIIKLLILFYRFHLFDSPSKAYRHIKGKSPLQLAGVDTSKLFWLNVGTNQ